MAHSSLDTLVAKVCIYQPSSMLNAPTRKLSHADTWLADCIQKGSMSPLYLAKFMQQKKDIWMPIYICACNQLSKNIIKLLTTMMFLFFYISLPAPSLKQFSVIFLAMDVRRGIELRTIANRVVGQLNWLYILIYKNLTVYSHLQEFDCIFSSARICLCTQLESQTLATYYVK